MTSGRGWTKVLAAAGAAGLLLISAAPGRAAPSAAPPLPALKPLLLEPLVWEEACTPAHTRVSVPVAAMSFRMRAAWGLPATAHPGAWGPARLLLLGRAYETGELGLPDPGEAARIYCLLLRHHGSRIAAFLLSRLHARGEGVAFSPVLADHFARVAALAWSPAHYRVIFTGPKMAAGEFPDDGIVPRQLGEARAWLAGRDEAPLRARYASVRALLAEGSGPRSEMLAARLFPPLARAAAARRETADIALAYLRHRLRTDPQMLRVGLESRRRLGDFRMLHALAQDLDYLPAQLLLAELYAEGRALPRDPVAAVLWLSRARANGATTGARIEALLADVPPDLRPAVAAASSARRTPRLLWQRQDVYAYRAHLAGLDPAAE
jgi:TPR repeat protein